MPVLEKARFGIVTSAFWDCFGAVSAQLYEAKANKKDMSVNSSFLFFFSFYFLFFSSCSLQEVWLEQVSWKVSFGERCDTHRATTVVQTWYNSLWLWRWLPHRLSKRQPLSSTTVLFRTTFTRTIKLNLLLKLLWLYSARFHWLLRGHTTWTIKAISRQKFPSGQHCKIYDVGGWQYTVGVCKFNQSVRAKVYESISHLDTSLGALTTEL